jgi:hypothetical protein
MNVASKLFDRTIKLIFLLLFFSLSQQALSADKDYTLFEFDPVNPIVTYQNDYVFVLNIPSDAVDIFRRKKNQAEGLEHCGRVPVGMRPVSAAVIDIASDTLDLWVVNHLSDSISVVTFNKTNCKADVIDTILVGDEPRDIVIAQTAAGARVLVTMAHRGQNHPDVGARSGDDLFRTPAENAALGRPTGLADIAVYNPSSRELVQVVNAFMDTPRALALGPVGADGLHKVAYVSAFLSGNRTSVIAAETARGVAVEHLNHLIHEGAVTENAQGDLIAASPDLIMQGGIAAVKGKGRCTPDPRPDRMRRHQLQLCVETDDSHRIVGFHRQDLGVVTNACSCNDALGNLQPAISTVVTFYDNPEECGEHYNAEIGGCWIDGPKLSSDSVSTPRMAWNQHMKFSLPDNDVVSLLINSDGTLTVGDAISQVGTTLFDMVTLPGSQHLPESQHLVVLNTDANNQIRFEGNGLHSGVSVRGNPVESRLTLIRDGAAIALNLNAPGNLVRGEKPLAFPIAAQVVQNTGPDDSRLFFIALGSDRLGFIDVKTLTNATTDHKLAVKSFDIKPRSQHEIISPIGLAASGDGNRLYVLSAVSHELIEINIRKTVPRIVNTYPLATPESHALRQGRGIFYYAEKMSENGLQSCASCHIFGANDGLAWDLGNPDRSFINNPGPFVSPPKIGFVSDLSVDPEQLDPYHRAVNKNTPSVKGPMLTQPLQGLQNHGPLHWRGDRIESVQFGLSEQPDTGIFNELNSLREFNQAVVDLVGNNDLLPPEKFDQLATFIMAAHYPPNPMRLLTDELRPDEQLARAAFFGCKSMNDEQFSQRQCVGTQDAIVAIDSQTRNCQCYGNPVRFVLNRFQSITEFAASVAKISTPAQLDFVTDSELKNKLVNTINEVRNRAFAISQYGKTPLRNVAASGNAAANNGVAQVYDAAQLHNIRQWITGQAEQPGLLTLLELIKTIEATYTQPILASIFASVDLSQLDPAYQDGGFDLQTGVPGLHQWVKDANVAKSVLLDAAMSPGMEQNLLQGCPISIEASSCQLRIADSLTTCQGCHTLDPDHNAEYGVSEPGVFGTNSLYAFSNVPQIFKVPHLRGLYQRVGKLGQPYEFDMFVAQSVHGIKKGGFFDKNPPYVGDAIRGYGISHDGSADTLYRFTGILDFLRRPAKTLGDDDVRGNPDAFDAFLPNDPASCLKHVETHAPDFFNALGITHEQARDWVPQALAGNSAAVQALVEAVVSGPAPILDARWFDIARAALNDLQQGLTPSANTVSPIVEAVAASLLCPNHASPQLMPLCFQLGSTLEHGDENGICYPSGFKERSAMERYMVAFDTNLKPMVGQQLTLTKDSKLPNARLQQLVQAAAAGHCDLTLVSRPKAFWVSIPDPLDYRQSTVRNDRQTLSLDRALHNLRAPATLTCYPPQPEQAEARRAVIMATKPIF